MNLMFQKLFHNFAVATALTLPVISLSTQSALASDNFGAIAYSSYTGSHGYSYNYATRQAAEIRALRECESYAGSGDCQVFVWFQNGCGALAKATDGAAGSGWGVDRGTAEYHALESCRQYGRDCKIIRWACTNR